MKVLSIAALALVGVAAAPPTLAWPGGAPARTADATGSLGGNVSGLAFARPTTLWAVRDAPSALLRLERTGGGWVPADGWGRGRTLTYSDGRGAPDAEAVTTVDDDPGAVFVAAERDSGGGGAAGRNSILRYEVAGTGTMSATAEWSLDAVLPASAANTGVEGLAWVPDRVLVAAGVRDDTLGRPYTPADHPGHGTGLFVVGHERDGMLWLVALGERGAVSVVSSFASGLDAVMEVTWSEERQELWALCDDACRGRAAVFRLSSGAFTPVAFVDPPSALASLNDEGFALAPGCTGGTTLAVWSDDAASDGHALREAALPCTPIGAPAPSTIGAAAAASTTAAPTTTARAALPPSTAAPSATAPPTTSAARSSGQPGRTAGVAGAVVAAIIAAALVWRGRRRRGSPKGRSPSAG
jgi:hypothetical protein